MKSMATGSPKVEKLKAAIAKWERTAKKHAKHGATDRETNTAFQLCLRQKIKEGKVQPIPGNARNWRLHHDKKGANVAAKRLTDDLLRVLDVIDEVPAVEKQELVEYLDGYLWRFHEESLDLHLK